MCPGCAPIGRQARTLLVHTAAAPHPDAVCRAAAAPSSSGGGLTDADAAVLSKMLSWPAAQLFPALDLARLLVLHRSAAEQLAAAAGPLAADAPRGGLGAAIAAACAGEPPVPTAQQTAVRLACNCFVQPALLGWVQGAGSRVLDSFAPCATSPNKNVRQGLATLLVNYSAMLSKLASLELEFKSRVGGGCGFGMVGAGWCGLQGGVGAGQLHMQQVSCAAAGACDELHSL